MHLVFFCAYIQRDAIYGNCSMLMIGDLEVKEIFRNFVAKNKEW